MAVHFWPADQKAPAHTPRPHRVEVGVRHDDRGVVAAELELHALAEHGWPRPRTCSPTGTEPVKEMGAHVLVC